MSRSRTVETIELLTATAIKNTVIILYNAVKTATPHQSPAVTASPQGEALRKITIYGKIISSPTKQISILRRRGGYYPPVFQNYNLPYKLQFYIDIYRNI